MEKNRDLRIDVLKGIGIICVIWAHLRGYFDMEIYIFHMPLFFFLSGMFYKNRRDFIPRRFKSLIVPFLLYTAAFSLLFHLQGGAWEKPIHRLSLWFPSAVVGPAWFLIALFNISVIYYLLDCLIKRKTLLLATTFAIGLIFYYYKIELPLDLRQSLYAMPFFALGRYMKSKELTNIGINRKILIIAALVFAGTVVYCRMNNFRFDILCSYLPGNCLLFYGGATAVLAGAIIILLNVRYFARPTAVNRALSSFGRHSLAIMALHMPYMFFLRRQIFRLHLFESPTANTVGTFFITFALITAASYLLAIAIDTAVTLSRRKLTKKIPARR